MNAVRRSFHIGVSVLLLVTNIPKVYSHPRGLASQSLFKLWKTKNISVEKGLIIQARLEAIHRSILDGKYSPEELRAVDREVVERLTKNPRRFLKENPLDYRVVLNRDNKVFGIRANIYKDKRGRQQLILFYNPNNPPWDILESEEFEIRTEEDREFAKRGYWIISIDAPEDEGRRTFLRVVGLLPFAKLAGCVFNTSGLPSDSRTGSDGGFPQDGGETVDGGGKDAGDTTNDAGVPPKDMVEVQIDTEIDGTNDAVTILPTSTFFSTGAAQLLAPIPEFVRNSNSAFEYSGINWQWNLSEVDRNNIVDNGMTYIFNGRRHRLKIIGQDLEGNTKTIIFNPDMPPGVDYSQPYRLTITADQINEFSSQIGMDLTTFDIYFENLEPEESVIVNGFQVFYAVLAQDAIVGPANVSSLWAPYSSVGITPDISATPSGTISINFNLEPGDAGNYSGIEISTISGNNISPSASVSVSSSYPGILPEGAIDGDPETDWASNGDLAGDLTPWIQLNWDSPQTISSITLRDRANSTDHITGGELLFSDGTTISVGELPNDGMSLVIEFPIKTITWVRFQVTTTSPETHNPGLAEFGVNAVVEDNSDLTDPEFDGLPFNIKGSTPVILQLIDVYGEGLSLLITAVELLEWRGVINNLEEAKDRTNPDFDLQDVRRIRIFALDTFVQTDGAGSAWLEIEGPVSVGGTRLEYATDDPDLTKEQRGLLEGSITKATHEKIEPEVITVPRGYEIRGVTKWPGVLTPLGFEVDGAVFSAFFIGRCIYVPHPDLLREKTADFPLLQTTVQKRLEIILGHEIDEARGIKDHAEVVLNEFDKYSINGLNFADIATILFRSFNGVIDRRFYEGFLTNLFMHGTGLFLSEDIFLRIAKEMIDIEADSDELRGIYRDFIGRLNGLVNSEIGGKELSFYAGSFDVTHDTYSKERGFSKIITKSTQGQTQGTVFIDLNRFFIRNTSLSSAVTIDIEYLKRFIAFARLLPKGVRIIGLTEKNDQDITIKQLLAIINSQVPDERFSIRYGVSFSDYMDVVGKDNITTSVSILNEDTLAKIQEDARARLKLIVPAKLGYNRVTDSGYEFYAAWEGLDKDRAGFMELMQQIAIELLDYLVSAKKITPEEKDVLHAEIIESIRKSGGIGFILTWYDPIQYYKTIESQKALLTAA